MFEARPPAKVNLTLEIMGRRRDGFHDLRSTFLRAGLSDRLTMQPGSGDHDRLTVSGLAGAPADGNLVLRALDALRAHAGIRFPPLDMTLEKRIPVAAGLGGGSSDAASALHLAQACWGVSLAPGAEMGLAAELGSDVPFFVSGHAAARVAGRGEHVEPRAPIAGALLLVTPAVGLSTARVFARHDELGSTTTEDPNALWPAAVSLEPSLGALRAHLEQSTGQPWLMSGSGSTLFAIYPSVEQAVDAGRRLTSDRSAGLEGALVHAVDLVGPDPAWRYP